MLVLSNLQKFGLIDKHNRKETLSDLAVALLDADYPPTTFIFYRNDKKEAVGIAWHEVSELDLQNRTIRVRDLNAGEVFDDERLGKEVLLRRDILDSVILDLQNRRATRANDLWLEVEGKNLVLRGADVSSAAIFRRLTRGWLGKPNGAEMYDWKYVEFLRGDAEAVFQGAAYHSRIARLAPGEIAGLIDAIPYLHAAELIVLLPDELAAAVFQVTSPAKQLQIFEELDEQYSVKMLSAIASDSAAQVIRRLDAAKAKKYLEKLPKEKSQKIIGLLRFPEGTVGSVMTNDVVTVPSNLTVSEARDYLTKPLSEPDFVYFIYTVEDEESQRLNGVMSLRNLVIADPDEKISDVADKYVSFLSPLDDVYKASFRVIDSHLAGMPVINNEGALLGALTIDAAVSAVAPFDWRDQAPRVFS